MKYENMNAFVAAKQLARAERDVHGNSLATRWEQLKDPEVRGMLVKNTALDVVRSTTPGRHIHDLMQGRVSGALVSGIGMAIASTQRGLGKRLLFSGVSLLLAKLMPDNGEKGILSDLATGIGGMVRRFRERRADRNGHDHFNAVVDDPGTGGF